MAAGKKTGGRKAGTPNKRTVALSDANVNQGLMPLDYMLMRLRDEELEPDKRMYAAKEAAPYLHARLTSIDAKVSGDLRIEVMKFADGRKAA